MQSPRSLQSPSAHSSFSNRRPNHEWPRLFPDLRLSTKSSVPYWASLPSPPMSGSPPSEDHLDPPQLAGHRRKRSPTPPTAGAATGVDSDAPPRPSDVEEQFLQQRFPPASTATGSITTTYPSPYTSAQTYSYGPANPPLVGPPITAEEAQPGPGEVSPKTTRKTKAHVASACMNCKKKHLRCDNARPCRRCVQSGKEVRFDKPTTGVLNLTNGFWRVHA